MKISIILEAIDKASKTTKAVFKAMGGASAAAQKDASKTTKAVEQSAKAYDAAGKAAKAAGAAAASGTSQAAQSAQKLQSQLQKIEKTAFKIGQQLGKGGRQIGRGLGLAATGVVAGGKTAAGVATGAGVVGAGAAIVSAKIIQPAAEFEKFGAVLEVTERSAEGAKKALAWVSDFAAKTPYDIKGVTESFVQMRAYGLDPMNGSLRTLGDASAAMNKPVMQAVEAMADAVTGENERLKEFGIKAAKVGKYFQYSFTGADGRQKTLKALANDRKAIEAAILKILDSKYAGSMDKMSKTWEGMTSNMGDAFTRFQLKIANAGLFDWLKSKITDFMAEFDRLDKAGHLDEMARALSGGLIEGLKIAWEIAKGFGQGLLWVGEQLKWLNENVISFKNMGLVLLALPFLPALLTITSGIVTLTLGVAHLTIGFSRLLILFARIGAFSWLGSIFRLMLSPLRLLGVVLRLLVTPIMLVARAFVAAGIAMLTTPIGWIIAGIAAVAGAAYLIYRNWDKLGPWFANLWQGIKSVAANAWNGFVSFLGSIGSLALNALQVGWDGIKALFGWSPVDALSAAWNSVLAFFGGWGGKALDAVKAAFQAIEEWIGGAIGKITNAFKRISDGAAAAWSYVFGNGEAAQKSLEQGLTADPAQLAAVEAATAGIRGNMEAIAGANTAATLSQIGGLSDDAARAAEAIGKLTGATSAAVQAVKSMLAGVSLQSHGVAMMATLAAGIRGGAGQAVAAVRETTQAMRDYLPHSPAKVGALSDLHRVQFSETLARAIKPQPAIKAVQAVTAGMAAALPSSVAAPAFAASAPLTDGVAANGGSSTVSLTYAPVITVQGGAEVETQFGKMLQQHADEIARIVDEAIRRKERLQY